jgi:hypothetical protein
MPQILYRHGYNEPVIVSKEYVYEEIELEREIRNNK